MNVDVLRTAIWTLVGAVVLLGVFFFALGGLDPGEAEVMAIVIAVLGVLWMIHFWRTRGAAEDIRMQGRDRERRGF